MRAERKRNGFQIALSATGENVDRLLHLERVSDIIAKRLIHIRDHRGEFLPAQTADAHHRFRKLARLFGRIHNRAAAGFNVEHDHIAARGELFGQNRRNDQRQAIHRRSYVAQRVKHLVRRRKLRRLADDRTPDVCHLLFKRVHRKIHAHSWNGFHLIERAAGKSEPAAGHLRHSHAAARNERHQHQRGRIPYAAGRMLVRLDAGNAAEIKHIA